MTISNQTSSTGSQERSTGKQPKIDPLLGKTINEKYEILELVGSGGFGSVYRARHLGLGKIVALKVLRSEHLENEQIAKRFQNEARVTSHISHPHVVTAFDYGISAEPDLVFMAMDYVAGPSLKDVLGKEQKLTVERTLHIITQVCDGIAEAHRKGVLHRDIKPSNIILTNQDNDPDFVKVTDFGIAKVIDESEDMKRLTLTATGEVMGTCQYMSPEQCQGQKLNGRSDVYSIGCVLFELLTGNPPFHGVPSISIANMHVMGKVPNLVLDSTDPLISNRLAATLSKTLEKEPSQRYQTVDDLRAELEGVQARLEALRSGKINRAALVANNLICSTSAVIRGLSRNFFKKKLLAAILSIVFIVGGIELLLFNIGPTKSDRNLTMRACIFPREFINSVLNHFIDSIKIYDSYSEKADTEELIDSTLAKAEAARLSGNFNQAIDKYNDAIDISRKHNLDIENTSTGGELKAHLAYCYLLSNSSVKLALTNALESLKIYDHCNLKNSPRALLSYAILGESCRLLGDSKAAEASFDRFKHISFEHSIDNVSPLELALGNVYAGNFYRDQDKLQIAETLYRRAITYWQNLGEPAQFNLGATFNSRALLEFKEGDLVNARQDLDNAMKALTSAHADNHDLAIVLFTLSDLFFAERDYFSWFNTRREATAVWASK